MITVCLKRCCGDAMKRITGLITKAISGFYYVEAADVLYECKARGILRKNGTGIYVGDNAVISVQDDDTGIIEEIIERKNFLVRPPVANLDRLFIVSSVSEPPPNIFILDKITALAQSKGIEPVIIFSKSDLSDCTELVDIYASSGIRTITYSIKDNERKNEIAELLKGRISAFTGNTGVGKSSLLNSVFPELNIETAEISKKLGRGKHTTRHSELYKVGGGYVADTPGFSALDIERYETIRCDELEYCFPEFEPYINKCKFTGCSHTCEPGCAVINAVNDGEISASRHESYKAMYNEVKSIPDWRM